MVKMGKSMNVASRLAAATALTGTLAACDGRFGRASQELFAPISPAETAEASRVNVPPRAPAAPGNPVYIGGSQAANDALYQQTYGAPIQGSGQEISNPNKVGYATSVYQDSSISAAPITDIPGGPVIDAGASAPSYNTVVSEPVYSTAPAPVAPLPVETGGYSAPIYSAPTSPAFPSIGTEPAYVPQSSLPQSQIFTDASADGGLRDIEPLLDVMPMTDEQPYGSTASLRYTAAEQTLPMVDMTSSSPAPAYSLPVEILEAEPLAMTEPMAIETVEVASLSGGGFMPMPRLRPARPARAVPVIKSAAVASPIPTARPAMLRTPIPMLRPIKTAARSGLAITEAPALSEPPKMIDMGPIFLEDDQKIEPTAEVETAALAPTPEPETPVTEKPTLRVIKPEDLEAEMAALDTSKIDMSKTEEVTISDAPKAEMKEEKEPEIVMAALEAPAAPTQVAEQDEDLGDLKELSGTSWRLASLNGEDVKAEAELHFDGTSGFAGGQGICNNYGGEFSESLKGEFDMANIFSTETECDDYALEKKYIVALESAAKYRMAPGLKELMLLGPDGKTIATFSAF